MYRVVLCVSVVLLHFARPLPLPPLDHLQQFPPQPPTPPQYFLASACTELYIPPTAQLSLRGFTVTGTFLRGTLDKLGVEPQVKRIGEYKSAGDQLLREDMSEAQREQLTALLEDITEEFCKVGVVVVVVGEKGGGDDVAEKGEGDDLVVCMCVC